MNGAVWFQDLAYSGPIVKGRISCVNLQGHGFKGIFFKKEIISTMFTIELSFGHCSWISIRSFDQFKDFFQYIHEDRLLRRHISRITVVLSSFLITNETCNILIIFIIQLFGLRVPFPQATMVIIVTM